MKKQNDVLLNLKDIMAVVEEIDLFMKNGWIKLEDERSYREYFEKRIKARNG